MPTFSQSPYKHCLLCPRRCGVNREEGQLGFCGETSALRLAFAGIHKGEEPPITGTGGSGTIFVSGCNLRCAFCQNYQLSGNALGRVVEVDEFSEICLALQNKGAENINIVTGSHATPAIAMGIEEARKRNLSIPVVWNTSGYEGEETLEILKDFVDIYLPDLKTLDEAIAAKYFNAPNYPENATAAILKMMTQRNLRYGSGQASRILLSGVMIRHLVLPGYLEATRQVLRWFSESCGDSRSLLSLLTQYTPVKTPLAASCEIPNRFLSEDEYEMVLSMLSEFGIDDGYCQELVTGSEWLPDFNRLNPFSSELSIPVWGNVLTG